jgi:hypothetical protein
MFRSSVFQDKNINEIVNLVKHSSLTSDAKLKIISHLLEERDSLIALTTQIEECEHRLELLRRKAESDLQSVRSSWTWRLGRLLLSPITIFRNRRN